MQHYTKAITARPLVPLFSQAPLILLAVSLRKLRGLLLNCDLFSPLGAGVSLALVL